MVDSVEVDLMMGTFEARAKYGARLTVSFTFEEIRKLARVMDASPVDVVQLLLTEAGRARVEGASK